MHTNGNENEPFGHNSFKILEDRCFLTWWIFYVNNVKVTACACMDSQKKGTKKLSLGLYLFKR